MLVTVPLAVMMVMRPVLAPDLELDVVQVLEGIEGLQSARRRHSKEAARTSRAAKSGAAVQITVRRLESARQYCV